MTREAEVEHVICTLIVSLRDLANGWPVRELVEPPEVTIKRALKLLPKYLHAEVYPDELLR